MENLQTFTPPCYVAQIPPKVFNDQKLPTGAVLLFSTLNALAARCGYAYATNEYLGKVSRGVSERSIQLWLSQLKERGYIRTLTALSANGHKQRRIYITDLAWEGAPQGFRRNVQSGHPQPAASAGQQDSTPSEQNPAPQCAKSCTCDHEISCTHNKVTVSNNNNKQQQQGTVAVSGRVEDTQENVVVVNHFQDKDKTNLPRMDKSAPALKELLSVGIRETQAMALLKVWRNWQEGDILHFCARLKAKGNVWNPAAWLNHAYKQGWYAPLKAVEAIQNTSCHDPNCPRCHGTGVVKLVKQMYWGTEEVTLPCNCNKHKKQAATA